MSRAGSGAAGLLRAVVRGTGAVTELDEADAVLRTALPLSRRIGFVATAGGSGTSTAAASVASVLAARRRGTVLAVDAAGGASGLGWHLPADAQRARAADEDTDQVEATVRRRSARSAADARAGLPRSGSGVHLLDLTGGGTGVGVTTWGEDVAPISRFFDVVVTDWGVRSAVDDLAEVAATSHALAVVARADQHAAVAGAALLAQLQATGTAPPLLLVLVDVGRTSDRLTAALSRQLDGPVVGLSHHPARAAAEPPHSRQLSARARRDQIRLAAELMGAVARPATAPHAVDPAAVSPRQPVPARAMTA